MEFLNSTFNFRYFLYNVISCLSVCSSLRLEIHGDKKGREDSVQEGLGGLSGDEGARHGVP